MKYPIILLISLCCHGLSAQSMQLCGRVTDSRDDPLFAVNVYLNSSMRGTITDAGGGFSLKLDKEQAETDTLVCSYMGFETYRIPVAELIMDDSILIVLSREAQSLGEITIKAKRSIAREFSMTRMERLDIYLNPNAAADPLKAISILPYSTNTEETANVVLRGSSAERSRVYINEVPVHDPVRNSQLNGMGFFSLFNTEIIDNQKVYASNPPLVFGNSSAGLVELKTRDEPDTGSIQLSLSLASAGVMVNRNFQNRGFLQAYGNHQFSGAFRLVNAGRVNKINSFASDDLGINQHYALGRNSTINIYSYIIREASDVSVNLFTTRDNMLAGRIRNFNVVNYRFLKNSNLLSVNLGMDISRSEYAFGIIHASTLARSFYQSVYYKKYFSDKLSVQAGLSTENLHYDSGQRQALFYYALRDSSPYIDTAFALKYFSPEAYTYVRYQALRKLIIGTGIRHRWNTTGSTAVQLNIHYSIDEGNTILLAAGRYYSFARPDFARQYFRDLSSNQYVLEYNHSGTLHSLQLSAFYKKEFEGSAGSRDIRGFEALFEKYLTNSLKVGISNTYLDSEGLLNDDFLSGQATDFDYFIRLSANYLSLKYCTVGLNFLFRPGNHYTPVQDSQYREPAGAYEPLYSDDINSASYDRYRSLNLSLSRFWSAGSSRFLGFLTVGNILDSHNQRAVVYNTDYTESGFDHYQRRTIYFGTVWYIQ